LAKIIRTIPEPNRTVDVVRDCDVVVAGGGLGGINQGWIERLTIREAETHPPAEIWGSTNKRLIAYWNDRSFFTVREGHIVYASLIDAEISSIISNQSEK
jgi:hypothetical protein